MTACPACGLRLPAYARFCARCGTPVTGLQARSPQLGLFVALSVGAALAGLVALAYAVVLAQRQLPSTNPPIDPHQLRVEAAGFLAVAAILFALQVVTVAALSRGREWGRMVGTAAGIGWALTCLGLPLGLLLLYLLWRPVDRHKR